MCFLIKIILMLTNFFIYMVDVLSKIEILLKNMWKLLKLQVFFVIFVYNSSFFSKNLKFQVFPGKVATLYIVKKNILITKLNKTIILLQDFLHIKIEIIFNVKYVIYIYLFCWSSTAFNSVHSNCCYTFDFGSLFCFSIVLQMTKQS